MQPTLEGADQLPATMTDDAKNLMLEKAHNLILLRDHLEDEDQVIICYVLCRNHMKILK